MSKLFEIVSTLDGYQKRFENIIEENQIRILRDCTITIEEYNELRHLIGMMINNKGIKMLERSFALVVSVFFVNCAKIHYYDGEIWGPVYKALGIRSNYQTAARIGEMFLKTIKDYDLVSLDETEGKKYLSPLLMHTYFSNPYSDRVFDRLNRIYDVVLERDISDEAIEEAWDFVFEKESNLDNERLEKAKLELRIGSLMANLEEYRVSDDLLYFSKEDSVNALELIDITNRSILEKNTELERYKEEKLEIDEAITISQQIVDMAASFSERIKDEAGKELNNLVLDNISKVATELMEKETAVNELIEETASDIRKLTNSLSVETSKLNNKLERITILGSVDIEEGWNLLENLKGMEKELNESKKKLAMLAKEIKLNEGNENISFSMAFTSSLYHLKTADKGVFKDFIKRLLLMMDTYYKKGTIDKKQDFALEFLGWYGKERIRTNNSSVRQPQQQRNWNNGNHSKVAQSDGQYRRLQVRKIRDPYISLNRSDWGIDYVVPEQQFSEEDQVKTNPQYLLLNRDGTEIQLAPTVRRVREGYEIYELINKLTLSERTFVFKWMNMREFIRIDIDPIMIFDQSGQLVRNSRLGNGSYFILHHSDWELVEGHGALTVNSRHKDHLVREVILNETSLIFRNRLTCDSITISGSSYHDISIEGLNYLEGVTVGGIPIIQDGFPVITLNKEIVDPDKLTLKLLEDGNVLRTENLGKIVSIDESSDNLLHVDVRSLYKNKPDHPVKIEVNIIGPNDEVVSSVEFIHLMKTEMRYEGNNLRIKLPDKAKIKHEDPIFLNGWHVINLNKANEEIVEVYYHGYDLVSYKVEVPSIRIEIIDPRGSAFSVGSELLKEELPSLKRHEVMISTDSDSIVGVIITNKSGNLNIKLPLKNGEASFKIDSIMDLLAIEDNSDILYINWYTNKRKGEKIEILKIHMIWYITSINVFDTEREEDFALEVGYKSNFQYKGPRIIRVSNMDRVIFSKTINDDNPYYYLSKDELKNDDILIEILRKKETGIFAPRGSNEEIVGSTTIKLRRTREELDRILRNGLILIKFRNYNESIELEEPATITSISRGEAINYVDEKIYEGVLDFGIGSEKVLFYIDQENSILPLLLDEDTDGAMYNTETGEFLWYETKDKSVIGPLEDFEYRIKEDHHGVKSTGDIESNIR